MRLAVAVGTSEVPRAIPVALFDGGFDEKLAKAAAAGLDGVELMTAIPKDLDTRLIRSSLRATGLEVAAIGSGAVTFITGLTLMDPDESRAQCAEMRLMELIDFASDVGSPLVTIGSFRGWVRGGGAEMRSRLVAVLRRGAKYAGPRGVRLAVEPINRYESDIVNTAEGGLELLRDVDHSGVGLLLDTYHVNIEESSWVGPFRRVSDAGTLWHVHLGDNNRLPPGEGLIDFSAIVDTLRQVHYGGYLSAELLAKPDPDTAAHNTVRYMRMILEASL